MKFKLIGDEGFTAYGYRFIEDEPVDVKEAHLIRKFEKYHQLEKVEAKRGPKPKNERQSSFTETVNV